MTPSDRGVKVPARSLEPLEQRRLALERANAVRIARAKLKKDLASGKADLAPLILDPPEFVAELQRVPGFAARGMGGRGARDVRAVLRGWPGRCCFKLNGREGCPSTAGDRFVCSSSHGGGRG